MKKSIASILPVFLIGVSMVMLFTPSVTAQQEVRSFTALLLPGNEVPPVNNADSGATGAASIRLTITRDGGGTITAATAKFDVTINNLIVSTNIILAHIHEAVAGVNGPVRVDSGLSPGTPVPVVNGNASFIRGSLFTPPAIAQGMIDNPAGFYFNAHSQSNPGGVVRGQLVRLAQRRASTPGTQAGPIDWKLLAMVTLPLDAELPWRPSFYQC